jgi:hypothetical protein
MTVHFLTILRRPVIVTPWDNQSRDSDAAVESVCLYLPASLDLLGFFL